MVNVILILIKNHNCEVQVILIWSATTPENNTPDLIGWGGGGGVPLDLKMHGAY